MDYLIERYHVTNFLLTDELFASKLDRVSEFCRRIKEKNVTWQISLRISSNVTFDLLTKMKDAGCRRIQYGLESACDEVLKSMKKGTTSKEMLRVLKVTKEVDLVMVGIFIFGDTVETTQTMQETFDWVYEHSKFMPETGFTPIRLFPGSALYDKAVAEGKITDKVQFIRDDLPLVNVSSMSDKEYGDMIHSKIPYFSLLFRKKVLEENSDSRDFKVFKTSKKEYQLTFLCTHCNQSNQFQLQPKDLTVWNGSCPHCQTTHTCFPSFFYYEHFEEKINQFLSTSKTAIWGAGGVFQGFYHGNSFVRENELLIVDSSKEKQMLGVNGLVVHPPEVLFETEIENLIICADNNIFSSFKESIANKFDKIKNIVLIYELGLEL